MGIATREAMPALLTFFVLCYLISWSCWFGASYCTETTPRTLLLYLGVFSPGIVALSLTAWQIGRVGVEALLRRLVAGDVALRWYVFAVSYIAVVKLTVALIIRVATGSWPLFGQESWYLMLLTTIASTIVGGQAGEELGWRGYALPQMAGRLGLGGASVLLGLLWACWHLPLFYFPGLNQFGQSIPVYILQVTSLSVAMAWLYANTNGSLLLMMLMHAAVNNTKGDRAISRSQRHKPVGAQPLAGRVADRDFALAGRGLFSRSDAQEPHCSGIATHRDLSRTVQLCLDAERWWDSSPNWNGPIGFRPLGPILPLS